MKVWVAIAIRRAQLSIRHGSRNYDGNIAGLGMGRAPRYFVFGFEGASHRLFGVSKIETLEAVESIESSSAVPHAVIQYGNAVLDLGRIDEGKLHEKSELLQLVEKKGKCFSSNASDCSSNQNRLDRKR